MSDREPCAATRGRSGAATTGGVSITRRKKLTDADRRALSALFWSHLNLYGKFEFDMSKQLDLGPRPGTEGQQSAGPL